MAGLASVAASQIVTDALTEIRVARAGDSIAPEIQTFVLTKLQRLFDRWNANPRAPYAVAYPTFTPTASLNPQTIGPSSAVYNTAIRPLDLDGINLLFTGSTPTVRQPLTKRDRAWWMGQSLQGLTATFSTDFYYEPTFPNGSLYLWPVPTGSYAIELIAPVLFASLALTDAFYLPPGYRDAITLVLAVEIAPGLGQTAHPDTKEAAKSAMAVIFGRNDRVPNAVTRDGGMPGGQGGGYNYRTGEVG